MGTNHTDVIRHHRETTTELLEHVDQLDQHLENLTANRDRTRNGAIADLHNEIGTSLKLAHIHATLAVAEALEQLAASRPASGPSPRAGDYL